MRFEELKLEDSDCDWMLPSDLKSECQLIPAVELNVLSFNSYILLIEFSRKDIFFWNIVMQNYNFNHCYQFSWITK